MEEKTIAILSVEDQCVLKRYYIRYTITHSFGPTLIGKTFMKIVLSYESGARQSGNCLSLSD